MPDPAVLTLLIAATGATTGAVIGTLLARKRAREEAQEQARETERIRAEAEAERQTAVREAQIAAREEAIARRAQAGGELLAREADVAARETALAAKEVRVAAEGQSTAERGEKLAERATPIETREEEERALKAEARLAAARFRTGLERVTGDTAEAALRALAEAEIEEAQGRAAHLLRQLADGTADPDQIRRAKRVMGIAAGRFQGHYLTERHHSLIPLEGGAGRGLLGEGELRAIEEVAHIKLSLTEAADAVRIEGLDGVGREVARRVIARVLKRSLRGAEAVAVVARELAEQLDREIIDLGRRAFSALRIDRAHPDIVKLVGRLNYRTSYTQNQWKHAVEAAFLCGMMAEEMGLDCALARRAALMHDIGKALTHELDGSHAVIGADYARRLGEPELVANAIGAHHTDEPFSTPYAYLVAAADAMSGARPGARRQGEDNHMAKLADLERLSRGFQGVGEAFAVQGGREVRIYVREDRVDDRGAVELSAQIAETISREMTFPGQIKVTVIREFRAVETAN